MTRFFLGGVLKMRMSFFDWYLEVVFFFEVIKGSGLSQKVFRRRGPSLGVFPGKQLS